VAILVDTSGLYALIDADDRHHLAVRRCLEQSSEALIVPVTVLPEIDYLVATRLGVRVELAMLRTLASDEIQVEPITPIDIHRCIELVEAYADSDIGLVDASIVAIAERLRILQVLTLDHRHFRMIRPRHCPALDLLP
jgi:uncharacterized protein